MSRVSICIPTYNSSRYIRETIKSVLDSNYTDFEVVVNDNASADNTKDIVGSFKDRRIRFYQNRSNLGPTRNWNCALQKASGEFIGLLYSDDLIGPFWLTLAVHVLDKHPHIGWVATSFLVINDKGKPIQSVSRFPESREYSRSEVFPRIARLDGFSPTYLARRRVLDEIGYYNEQIGRSADNLFFMQLTSRYTLYYSNNACHTAYRDHAEGLHQDWGLIERITECLKILDKTFNDKSFPEELRKYEKASYIHFYNFVLRAIQRLLDQKQDLETVQELIHLLCANGYREANSTAQGIESQYDTLRP